MAIALGLLLAVPFGYLGYKATSPKYRSTGIVRVQVTLPKTLYETDEGRALPMFDSFVNTQAAILKTRRVLDRAVEDPKLRSTGWPQGIAGVAALERALTVSSQRNSEMIMVTVTDTQPGKAQAAVNAVLAAFEVIQDEFSGTSSVRKERELTDRQAQLSRSVKLKQEEILQLSMAHGTADLDPIYDSRINELTQLETYLTGLNTQIGMIEAQQAANGGTEGEGEAPSDEILAMTDPQLGLLYTELSRLDSDLRGMESAYGPRHPDMINLRRIRDGVKDQIDDRKRRLLAVRQVVGANGGNPGVPAGMGLAELRRLRDSEAARLASVREEFQRLGRAKITIDSLKEAELDLKLQLVEVNKKLTALDVERQNLEKGRVLVAQRGEAPTGPATDRRKELGLIGAMGGGGLGVALVALFGLMRNGYRYIDDVEHNGLSVPLLGTIPDLRTVDPEHDEMAALSVHHLRNMLEQSGPPGPRAIHAITSGSSGDGKTSLALALGMSFAVSGHRTLLLDADLIGRRLSRLLGLSKQQGLSDAIGKPVLNGEVHQTRVPNLWAIPSGTGVDFSPEKLSSADFDQLFEQLRARFDRIIIDTGPVLGSLEASLVCPLADRVVLIVSAGQSPRLVQASIRRLEQLGAPCAGMVFNRARRDDFARSVSAAPLSRSIRAVERAGEGESDISEGTSLIRALEAERNGRERGPAA